MNYGLKITAFDNSSSYDIDASEIAMKNLYVNDLLKSVKRKKFAVDREEPPVKLIKRVKDMCIAGFLNFMVFISNRKNVLMNIPDIHRKEVATDPDSVKKEVPMGRLGSKLGC